MTSRHTGRRTPVGRNAAARHVCGVTSPPTRDQRPSGGAALHGINNLHGQGWVGFPANSGPLHDRRRAYRRTSVIRVDEWRRTGMERTVPARLGATRELPRPAATNGRCTPVAFGTGWGGKQITFSGSAEHNRGRTLKRASTRAPDEDSGSRPYPAASAAPRAGRLSNCRFQDSMARSPPHWFWHHHRR